MRHTFHLLLLATSLTLLGSAWWYFPAVDAIAWQQGPPPDVWQHRAQDEQLLGHGRRTRFHYVPLQQIALPLQLAILVAEDSSFFQHGPMHVAAQWEAVLQWWQQRPWEARARRLRGASTITQQLAKNLFLTAERSLLRKLQELRMAYWLERHLSKQRIFELYLNIIELGPHLYGVEAAAHAYFNSNAAQLNAAQAALLAAAIPAPMLSNPRTRSRAFAARHQAVLSRVEKFKHLQQTLHKIDPP